MFLPILFFIVFLIYAVDGSNPSGVMFSLIALTFSVLFSLVIFMITGGADI